MTAIAGIGVFLCFAAVVMILAYRNGAAEERLTVLKDKNDSVDKASAIRDRLRHDADYASRLRKRFTR